MTVCFEVVDIEVFVCDGPVLGRLLLDAVAADAIIELMADSIDLVTLSPPVVVSEDEADADRVTGPIV